eukprot:scaffold4559_cov145-Skeletonema_menzelii.AAC.3
MHRRRGKTGAARVAMATKIKKTTTMTDTSKVRAVAWDPSGTASLSICPIPSTDDPRRPSSNSAASDEFLLDVFLSHDGTGCNAEETECLLRQLDARDDWIEEQAQARKKKSGTNSSKSAITKLSMDYRAAMCECLMQLQKQQKQQDMSDNNDGSSSDNLELLTLTFAISHLAEIFLLPSLSSSSSNFRGGLTTNNYSRLDGGPSGSLTADTVRYLRLHHSRSHALLDSPEVEELLSSDQPEYYKSSNTSISGPFEYPYWNLVLQLVKGGQLDNAWTVLAHHSACRHAEEAAMTGRPLTPEGEGFATLRAILLSAPLPGGRGDDYCVDDAGLDDFLEEDILEREEKEARLNAGFNNSNDNDDDEENAPPENINELYVDGVPRNGYLLWEDRPRHADRLRKLRYLRDLRKCGQPSDESEYHSPTVLPEVYQPNSAMSIFHTWQDVIKREASFTSGGSSEGFGLGSGHRGGLDALFRRFPPLQQILSVLVGKVPPNIANDPNLTWSETLLMELLYSRPDISPENIAARANAIMSRKGDGRKHALDEIILSIMSGSAGQVVETMFSLCGGSSGAALPATVTSLLCNLLIDAGCISSAEASSSSSVNIQTELLILAAEAILSSFSVQEQSNVGVRAAVRLLLPHAPPKRIEGKVVYEPRISATIAVAISHRLPDSDAEARDLLHLCEEAIRLGSVRIADACESLAFSRASFHRSKGHLHREVYWLLRGMEILSNELPTQFQRKLGFACRRHFDALCENSANDLISMLASTTYDMNEESKLEEEAFVSVLQSARKVLEAVVLDEDMASLLKGHIQANLLKYVVDIALADALGDTTKMASNIVRCLEERCLPGEEYGGVVSTLANPKMYAKLLHISVAILHKEESLFNGTMELTKCAFSVHGMHILMARLTQVLSWEGIITSSSAIPKTPTKERKEYFQAMRLTLCKGLMRAFASAQTNSNTEKDGKGGRVEQSLEDEVELMLSPCI